MNNLEELRVSVNDFTEKLLKPLDIKIAEYVKSEELDRKTADIFYNIYLRTSSKSLKTTKLLHNSNIDVIGLLEEMNNSSLCQKKLWYHERVVGFIDNMKESMDKNKELFNDIVKRIDLYGIEINPVHKINLVTSYNILSVYEVLSRLDNLNREISFKGPNGIYGHELSSYLIKDNFLVENSERVINRLSKIV